MITGGVLKMRGHFSGRARFGMQSAAQLSDVVWIRIKPVGAVTLSSSFSSTINGRSPLRLTKAMEFQSRVNDAVSPDKGVATGLGMVVVLGEDEEERWNNGLKLNQRKSKELTLIWR